MSEDTIVLALRALVGEELQGGEKFGWLDGFAPKLGEEEMYSVRCLVCGFPFSCHHNWRCPTQEHRTTGRCAGKDYWRKKGVRL